MGWMVLLAVSLALAGGCKHQTPEQKAQAKLAKQQMAADKAAQKQAQADARAEHQRAAEQAKASKKAAEERAREAKHQVPESVKQNAMASADYYPDDRMKVIGYPDIHP